MPKTPVSSTKGPQSKPFQISNKNVTERAILCKNVNTRRILPKAQRTTEPKETPFKILEQDNVSKKRRYENVTSGNKNNKENEKKESISDENVTSDDSRRKKVKRTLDSFRALCGNLDKKFKGDALPIQVSRILKHRGKFIDDGKETVGKVSGIEVGDEFQYWEQLNVVGLHRQNLSGIDYVIKNGKMVATSVVTSCFSDKDHTKVFVYTGEGGNGNLALKNSFDVKNPIRVIIKFNSKKVGGPMFCYYGLYKVESFQKKIGKSGYKFCLVRLPNQKEVAWNELKECEKNYETKKCLFFVEDISKGKEIVPIRVVNRIDYDRVPFFQYITHMMYPKWCEIIKDSSAGRKCVGECFDSLKCVRAREIGGKIPFHDCKCSSRCYHRVHKNGIKFKLEIFKTNAKGWGVRSYNAIPSGSFVCEYLGNIIEDVEALKMVDNEYLFNINHKDDSLREEDSYSASSSDSGRLTIDASYYGNVARFINHSCSPNLFAKNVVYDHDDTRIPHIMLFAAEDIPTMNELTYNYNYKIDQVIDSNGNVKMKKCYCAASDCIGRLY